MLVGDRIRLEQIPPQPRSIQWLADYRMAVRVALVAVDVFVILSLI
jgi:hypothetical protein